MIINKKLLSITNEKMDMLNDSPEVRSPEHVGTIP